jgi:hypothetical protein
VVSCPKDLTMFEDALKATGNEGRFVVKELIELVREALESQTPELVGASEARQVARSPGLR